MPNLSDFLNSAVAGASVPSQTGQTGKYLETVNGSLVWSTPTLLAAIDCGNSGPLVPDYTIDGGDYNGD